MKTYTQNLHHFLSLLGDEVIAVKQSQYMRNRFPFIGLMKDQQTKYWKEYQEEFGKIELDQAVDFAKECIKYPEREMWYIATSSLIKHKKKLKAQDLEFINEYIVKSDWWDVVDIVSSNVLGTMCKNFPELRNEVNSWIENDNFWPRRAAIIYQLTYRNETNEEILYQHVLKTCHEKEFFIRKAIGWALREYSKHNKSSVKNFIEQNSNKLSKLSITEGSKYL